jgi:ABC-type sugar transport system ATPase subunit
VLIGAREGDEWEVEVKGMVMSERGKQRRKHAAKAVSENRQKDGSFSQTA